ISRLADTEDSRAEKIFEQLWRRAPYWCLVLTMWRKHLGERGVSTSRVGLYNAAYTLMQGVQPEEVEECIRYLDAALGVIASDGHAKKANYELNPKYVPAIQSYVSELVQLRPRLLQALHSN